MKERRGDDVMTDGGMEERRWRDRKTVKRVKEGLRKDEEETGEGNIKKEERYSRRRRRSDGEMKRDQEKKEA